MPGILPPQTQQQNSNITTLEALIENAFQNNNNQTVSSSTGNSVDLVSRVDDDSVMKETENNDETKVTECMENGKKV